MIDAGADVNIADENQVTPLKHAVDRGYGRIAELLRVASDAVQPNDRRTNP